MIIEAKFVSLNFWFRMEKKIYSKITQVELAGLIALCEDAFWNTCRKKEFQKCKFICRSRKLKRYFRLIVRFSMTIWGRYDLKEKTVRQGFFYFPYVCLVFFKYYSIFLVFLFNLCSASECIRIHKSIYPQTPCRVFRVRLS